MVTQAEFKTFSLLTGYHLYKTMSATLIYCHDSGEYRRIQFTADPVLFLKSPCFYINDDKTWQTNGNKITLHSSEECIEYLMKEIQKWT